MDEETDLEVRLRYVSEVRGLANEARKLLADGMPIEAAARDLVRRRNEFKRSFRLLTTPWLVPIIEARNLKKYGDPLGPSATALRLRYGSWEAVIEAACRPGGEDLETLLSSQRKEPE